MRWNNEVELAVTDSAKSMNQLRNFIMIAGMDSEWFEGRSRAGGASVYDVYCVQSEENSTGLRGVHNQCYQS